MGGHVAEVRGSRRQRRGARCRDGGGAHGPSLALCLCITEPVSASDEDRGSTACVSSPSWSTRSRVRCDQGSPQMRGSGRWALGRAPTLDDRVWERGSWPGPTGRDAETGDGEKRTTGNVEKGDLGAGCPLGGATGSLVPGVLGGSSEPHRPGSALVALTAFKGEKPGEETEKNWAQRRDESREHRPRGAWARGGGHLGSSDGGLGQARLSQVGVPVTGGCPWVPPTVTGGCPWVPLTHRWCVPGYHRLSQVDVPGYH